MSRLPHVEEQLLAAARRRYGTSHTGRRTRLPDLLRRGIAMSAVLMLLGVSGAVTAVVLTAGDTPGTATEAGQAGEVSQTLQKSFGVLSRPEHANDALPPDTARMIQMSPSRDVERFGLELGASRLVASRASVMTFFVPGGRGACIATRGSAGQGFACLDDDLVALDGISTSQADLSRTERRQLMGIVPDPVARVRVTAADGAMEEVEVVENGFATDVAPSESSRITWLDADGRVIRSVPAP